MKLVRTPRESEQFRVIGIGLPEQSRHRIHQTFPRSIFQPDNPEGPAETRRLCDLLDRVVIFLYLPVIMDRIWVRASAIVSLDLVKVIGVHSECTDSLYDRALEAEFAGVLCDNVDPDTYRRAAISVQRGELWFPRAWLSHRTRAAAFSNSSSELSDREAEVLPPARRRTNQSDHRGSALHQPRYGPLASALHLRQIWRLRSRSCPSCRQK